MIVTSLVLLVIFLILLLVTIKIPVSIGAKLGFFAVLIGVIICIKLIKGFVPMPIGVRHIFHLVFSPKDLLQPVVEDNFKFYEANYSRTYKLKPKYLDFYEIGVSFKEGGISSKYKFTGKLKAEFFYKDKLVFEKLITSMGAAVFLDNRMEKFKEFGLLTFEMPLSSKYARDISVKLTVIEPDKELEKYKEAIRLYIGVSPTP